MYYLARHSLAVLLLFYIPRRSCKSQSIWNVRVRDDGPSFSFIGSRCLLACAFLLSSSFRLYSLTCARKTPRRYHSIKSSLARLPNAFTWPGLSQLFTKWMLRLFYRIESKPRLWARKRAAFVSSTPGKSAGWDSLINPSRPAQLPTKRRNVFRFQLGRVGAICHLKTLEKREKLAIKQRDDESCTRHSLQVCLLNHNERKRKRNS